MNGKSPMISHAPPFVLRLSKDERRVFQQNHNSFYVPGIFSVSSLGLAALDADRRQSKSQKDLADIARNIEVPPELRSRALVEFLSKLL